MSSCTKVFCVNCMYFNACKKSTPCNMTYDDNDIHERCMAPNNIRPTYMSDGSNKFIAEPSEINRFNDCQWFVAKGITQDCHILLTKHNNDVCAHEPIRDKITELEKRLLEAEQKISYLEEQLEINE